MSLPTVAVHECDDHKTSITEGSFECGTCYTKITIDPRDEGPLAPYVESAAPDMTEAELIAGSRQDVTFHIERRDGGQGWRPFLGPFDSLAETRLRVHDEIVNSPRLTLRIVWKMVVE